MYICIVIRNMVNYSNISPFWRWFWTILTLVILTGCLCFGIHSCKRKTKDKGSLPKEVVEKPAGVEFVESLEYADFSFARVKGYFLGDVNGNACILSIESAGKTKVNGNYYLIDSMSNSAAPVPFKLLKENDGYRFIAGALNEMVTFSISADSSAILGTITTLGNRDDVYRLAFKQYQEPVFREAKSTRYREPQCTFTKIPDIQYGKAKGFWTSYPMEDDTNYTKMIFKLLPKTLATKQLDLHLDLYVPDDSTHKHPLFVLLHGGAFFFGDKGNRNMREWCEHFAKCGYAVASVNYRLGFGLSKSSIQQCGYQAIQDAHAALRYLVAHAEEYGIDPNYIFLAGTSAGSITALGTTFMDNSNCPPFVSKNKLAKKCGALHTADNEYRNEVRIKGLANMWGAVYDLHELDGRHVPVVSFHGTEDKIVPFDQGFPFSGLKSKIGEMMFDKMYGSMAIHHYLDSMHVRNKLYPLEGCGHAPHQEKNGKLNKYYYFIQEKIQDFFYPELKTGFNLKQDDRDKQRYSIDNEGVSLLSWQAEGGLILGVSGNSVRVIWLDDAPKQLLRVSGFSAIGMPIKQEWNARKVCS